MMATPKAMAAMVKLVILRMSASFIGPPRGGIRPIKDSLGRSSRSGCDAHHQNTFSRAETALYPHVLCYEDLATATQRPRAG
jgi:hypothetical protein